MKPSEGRNDVGGLAQLADNLMPLRHEIVRDLLAKYEVGADSLAFV